jgi:hypothetical protein
MDRYVSAPGLINQLTWSRVEIAYQDCRPDVEIDTVPDAAVGCD